MFCIIVGSDDVNVSRGIRVLVRSQFDSVDLPADIKKDNGMIICRCESASMLPAEFGLYHCIGKGFAGKQDVPLYPSSIRALRNATTRREDIRKAEKGASDKLKRGNTIASVHEYLSVLNIAPVCDGTVASAEVITDRSTTDVVVDVKLKKTRVRICMSWSL